MCVCVWALKGKLIELRAPNFVDVAVARHALTLRSKDQQSRSRGYKMCWWHGYVGRYDCLGFYPLLRCFLQKAFHTWTFKSDNSLQSVS